MAHQNIVLQEILRHLPGARLNALVSQHQADKHVRTLPTRTLLITLLYAQLAGLAGLRETADVTRTQAKRLRHLGIRPVPKSTLDDALHLRPAAVFQQLFAFLVSRSNRKLRRDTDGLVLLIDSTSLHLNRYSEDWAKFSTSVCGAKAHVIYDPDGNRPIYAAVTPARVNDITAAHDMPIEPGATYVFDLGYYDFAWWQRMHEAGCRIVTRLKGNTPLTVRWEKRYDPGLPILSDRIGTLPGRQAHNRRNPFQAEVREVRVRTQTGTILRVLTNDLDAPVQEIADLYKRRWAIELFFRWIKQNLKIKRFMATSENAIQIQVFAALIGFLLLRLAHAAQAGLTSMVRFVRTVRGNLLERRSLDDLVADLIRRPPRTPKPEMPRVHRQRTPPTRRLFGNIFGGVGCLEF
jgi:IS4 transposase